MNPKILKIFHFSKPEGFSVIKSYLTTKDQIFLAQSALNQFCRKPHRTNLYIYDSKYKETKGALFKDAKTYNFEHFNEQTKYSFNRKIRWANLGYHYDWDNRCYYQDKKSDIPGRLGGLVNR